MYENFLIVIVYTSQEEEAALTRAELSEKVMITDFEFHRTNYYFVPNPALTKKMLKN